MNQNLPTWTPTIVKGKPFKAVIKLVDLNAEPVPLLSAQIDVTPNGAPALSWTQENGKFISVGRGSYQLDLTETDTSALPWETGRYRVSVVDSAGDPSPCLIEGPITAEGSA